MQTWKIGKTIFKIQTFLPDLFFAIFRCASGFSGQRCEFKTVDSSHSIVLRSHTSSKCVLGLTHYPCWKCPESRRENVWNPDCPDLKKIPGFPDQTWRPVEPYAPKSYIFQMCSRANSLPLLKIFSVTLDVELEVTELIWVNLYP